MPTESIQSHTLDLSTLYGLSEAERIQARDLARENIRLRLGEKPNRALYDEHHARDYPRYVVRTVTAITLVLLVAFFAISAMRLYTIGSQTFGATIEYPLPKIIAGIAIVVGAESGALGFMLASGVLARDSREKGVMLALALASTLIALTGNAQFALGANWNSMIVSDPFAIIEAILPPFVVLGGALVFERIWLDDIRRHHKNESAYQADLAVWKQKYNYPEGDPGWRKTYMHSLKQKLIEVNSKGRGKSERESIMAQMNGYHWRALVERELKADDWTQLDVIEPIAKSNNGMRAEDNPLALPVLASGTN